MSNSNIFFSQSENAYVTRDLKQLKKIADNKWKTHHFKAFKCNVIMLDVYISIINNEIIVADNEDLDFLFTYLFDVEIWGYYELKLYNSTMFLMDVDMIMRFSKIAVEKSTRFRDFKKIDKVIIPILINTLIFLLNQQTFNPKQYGTILHYLENIHIPEDELYIRNSLLQVNGLYEIKTGNQEKGIETTRRSIAIFNELGAYKLARTTENYLQFVLNKNQMSEAEFELYIQDFKN